jgi:2-amino-4-hydroxy-6-hydroxymethyldihydropteridine diphosphokinase
MSLADLLDYTDELEKEAGRVRVYRGRYDSRTLDIDVVMFGDLQGMHNGREWPSDDINENAHVLLPMSEIAGEKRHPSLGIRFNQLWQEFNQDAQQLTRVERFW